MLRSALTSIFRLPQVVIIGCLKPASIPVVTVHNLRARGTGPNPSQKILAYRQGNHDEGGWCEVRMGTGNLNEGMEEGGHLGSSRAFGL